MTEHSIRLLLRITARTSFFFFLCAFLAPALAQLWPARFTHWLARQRDRAILAFAASHTVHLAAIIALAAEIGREKFLHPGAWTFLIGGGTGYLFMFGLTLAVLADHRLPWLESSRFQAVAYYVIWGIFAFTFAGHAIHSMFYVPFALVAIAAFAVRLAAAFRAARLPAASPAPR